MKKTWIMDPKTGKKVAGRAVIERGRIVRYEPEKPERVEKTEPAKAAEDK